MIKCRFHVGHWWRGNQATSQSASAASNQLSNNIILVQQCTWVNRWQKYIVHPPSVGGAGREEHLSAIGGRGGSRSANTKNRSGGERARGAGAGSGPSAAILSIADCAAVALTSLGTAEWKTDLKWLPSYTFMWNISICHLIAVKHLDLSTKLRIWSRATRQSHRTSHTAHHFGYFVFVVLLLQNMDHFVTIHTRMGLLFWLVGCDDYRTHEITSVSPNSSIVRAVKSNNLIIIARLPSFPLARVS